MAERTNILVIKLSALGDFIQALGPMAAIRKHHPNARITLLTTGPFEHFAKNCGYFDAVWIHKRPKLNPLDWLAFRSKLNTEHFTRVYDLQNNDRTALYLKLFNPKPEWVGAAKGASHANTSAARTARHAFDGHVQTLKLAGIENIEIDTLDWMTADISGFDLKTPYVLLVPGSAPQHPGKRWPAEYYAALAQHLHESDLQPVILGSQTEQDIAQQIKSLCPSAVDLTGQTTLEDIVTLARDAHFAVGNDTGPIHLIAATSCPSLVLFSQHSNPVRHAPKGAHVHVLQSDNLANLNAEKVISFYENNFRN